MAGRLQSFAFCSRVVTQLSLEFREASYAILTLVVCLFILNVLDVVPVLSAV